MPVDPVLAAEAIEHPGRVSRRVLFPGVDAHVDDLTFWRARTFSERLAAMEVLRRLVYGEEACMARMQRTIEVVAFEDIDRCPD